MPSLVDIQNVRDHLAEVGLRPSSIKTMILQINRVLNGVFDTNAPTLKILKRNTNEIMKWIESDALPNYNSRKQHLNSINHLFKTYDIKHEGLEQKIRDYNEMSNAEITQLGTNEKRVNLIQSVDFEALEEQMRKEKNLTKKLVLALYTLIPPLRQQDYLNLPVFDKAPKTKSKRPVNYMDLRNKVLVIGNHKTSDSNGEKIIDLPDELIAIIRKYLRYEESSVILPMTSSNFTKYFQRHFNGLSPQVLRKAFVSQYANGMSVEERFKLGRLMGHKISTSQLQYNKPELVKQSNEQKQTDEDQ